MAGGNEAQRSDRMERPNMLRSLRCAKLKINKALGKDF
jgi:hypothetical protein